MSDVESVISRSATISVPVSPTASPTSRSAKMLAAPLVAAGVHAIRTKPPANVVALAEQSPLRHQMAQPVPPHVAVAGVFRPVKVQDPPPDPPPETVTRSVASL